MMVTLSADAIAAIREALQHSMRLLEQLPVRPGDIPSLRKSEIQRFEKALQELKAATNE